MGKEDFKQNLRLRLQKSAELSSAQQKQHKSRNKQHNVKQNAQVGKGLSKTSSLKIECKTDKSSVFSSKGKKPAQGKSEKQLQSNVDNSKLHQVQKGKTKKQSKLKPKEIPDSTTTMTALQKEMSRKLEGAQFRWLNEQLYTSNGTEAFKLMKQQPHLFEMYHAGFRTQAESWPENPVEKIIQDIKAHQKATSLIVDLGCGDALIAQTLKPLGYKVRSFDLVAKPPNVEAADMANVPVEDATCNMVIFCLSLMNTNWGSGAVEGVRILKKGGIMKIVEVVSRIPDMDQFIEQLQSLGLHVVDQDKSNKMFLMLTLRKKLELSAAELRRLAQSFPALKPCAYKKR